MTPPNILILYTDQQRADALGASGNHHIHTPNLDALAAGGVNFTNCFVQSPLCMPSRASFLTGRYPSSLGITHMGVPLPEDTLTLPRYLQNRGYTSANIGKLHFLPHANRDHRTPHPSYGFDQLEISDEPGCYEDSYRAWVKAKYPDELDKISVGLPKAAKTWQDTLNIDDDIIHPDERFPKRAQAFRGRDEVTHSAFVAEQSIDFIEQHQGKLWLCIAGFYSPHSPWVAPQKFLDLYDPDKLPLPEYPKEVDNQRGENHFSDNELRAARHGYYAMVSEVDHHVGEILNTLKKTGQDENTIIVFTSDHGEWLGEHLRYGKGYPGDDAVTNVPLIIRPPHLPYPPRSGSNNSNHRATGRTFDGLVEAVDVLPTLLDCAGAAVAPALQGESLWPACCGQSCAGKDSALTEFTNWKTLRSKRYRYLCEANGSEALYDLQKDPQGYQDVSTSPEYAEALAQMRHALLTRILKAEQPLPRTWPY